MTESSVFAAPWDQKITIITVLVSLLILTSSAIVIWMVLDGVRSAAIRALMLFGATVALAALAGAVLLAPRRYTIQDDRVVIERAVCPVEIPIASIRAVEPLSPGSLSGSLRVLGSGGLFGYFGRFCNQALGDYRMYATRGDGYVLVRADRSYVLTPEAPDRFIEALNRARQPHAGGGAL